jgi:shikimate dehydrogenase
MSAQSPIPRHIRNGVYGVVGHNIQYSQSPAIFRRAFETLGWHAVYALCDMSPAHFKRFVTSASDAGIIGFNVTQPYKVRILDLLNRLDPTAKAVGAVNTVACLPRGLIGYNTDVHGVAAALASVKRQLRNASVVMIGAGGAARAVAYALVREFEVSRILFAVRSPQKGRRIIRDLQEERRLRCPMDVCPLVKASMNESLEDSRLLVNATPVGSVESKGKSPLPKGLSLPSGLIVFDLVYRPSPTKLLREAKRAGCKTIGGWPMLVGQADAAFRIWTGRGFPLKTRQELLATERSA